MDIPIANCATGSARRIVPLVKVRDENGWHVVVTDTFANPIWPNASRYRNQPEPMTLTLGVDNRSVTQKTPTAHPPRKRWIWTNCCRPAPEKTIAPAQPAVKNPSKAVINQPGFYAPTYQSPAKINWFCTSPGVVRTATTVGNRFSTHRLVRRRFTSRRTTTGEFTLSDSASISVSDNLEDTARHWH